MASRSSSSVTPQPLRSKRSTSGRTLIPTWAGGPTVWRPGRRRGWSGHAASQPRPLAIVTLLRTVDAGAITEPEIVMDGAMLIVTWSEHGVRRGLTIDSSRPGAV